MDFDAFPTGILGHAHNINATTNHIAAPGAGKRIVVLSGQFGVSAGAVRVRESGGGVDFTDMHSDAADTVLPHNPYGWFLLAENKALETDVAVSSTLVYRTIDA